MSSNSTASNGIDTHVSAATKLRRMIEDPKGFVFAPGVYDGFSARVADRVGFDCLYMTGAGTSASTLGSADVALLTLNDMIRNASVIANLNPNVPLIADMDTGFGSPVNVNRAVSEYIRAGIAGFHIEDQVQNKRCGHLQGKEIIPPDVFESRIRAAVQTRKRMRSDIVVIARTDALQSYGYDEAVRRLKAARDSGADVGFFEGVTSKEMARRAVKDMSPWPMLLNMVEHGATPTMTRDEAREIGFRVMIWPFAAWAPAYVAMKEGLEKVKREGKLDTPEYITPRHLFEICGLEESMRIDRQAGGVAFNQAA